MFNIKIYDNIPCENIAYLVEFQRKQQLRIKMNFAFQFTNK